MGPEGPEGPEGPPGVIDFFYSNVENDQGIVGSTIGNGTIGANNYGQTPFPATLSVNLEAGTYLLTWSAEVMRTTAGASTPFFVRLHEGPKDAGTTYGFLRQRSMVENGPPGNMPDDPEFFALGDVIPFSGSAVLALPDGPRTFRLEYALSSSTTSSEALRAQHQRITLLRLE